MVSDFVTKSHSDTGNHYKKKFKKITMKGLQKAWYYYSDCLPPPPKMDQFVSVMQVGQDSRWRPIAESCNAAIAGGFFRFWINQNSLIFIARFCFITVVSKALL